MEAYKITLIISGMAIATLIPRIVPLLLLNGRNLPPLVTIWLKYVPPSLMAALVAPELFLLEGKLSTSNLYLWASLPTIVVTIWKKNLLLSVLSGIGGLTLLRLVVN